MSMSIITLSKMAFYSLVLITQTTRYILNAKQKVVGVTSIIDDLINDFVTASYILPDCDEQGRPIAFRERFV